MKLLSALGWIMGFMLALPADAELQIEVTQGVDDAVNIAVVPFGWLGRGELPEELHEVIASDLQLSGRFQALSVNQMLSLPSVSSDVYVRDWELLNTEYLVLGQIEESGADLELSFELYDVFKGAVVFQQTIIGRDLDLRDMGHHVSDAVYEVLTGVPGAFSTEILYITVAESENGRVFRLNVADADGHGVRTVLQSREPILSGSWAPDGDQITYVSFERDSRPAIYIHNIRTRKRQQVTNFKGLNSAPAFSPDGTKLAMVLSKDGNPEIYVLDLDSQPRKLRRLTRHYGIDTEPSWSADGESIIFTSNRGGQPQIYSMRLKDLEVERLTFEGDYNARAVLANRGDGLIMVHRKQGVFHIAYLDLNRGFLRVLTETSLDESPTIAPNDSLLIYATQVDGRGILAGVSIDGGVRFNLPATEGDVREPAWSPRKKKIFNPIVETDLKSPDKME